MVVDLLQAVTQVLEAVIQAQVEDFQVALLQAEEEAGGGGGSRF